MFIKLVYHSLVFMFTQDDVFIRTVSRRKMECDLKVIFLLKNAMTVIKNHSIPVHFMQHRTAVPIGRIFSPFLSLSFRTLVRIFPEEPFPLLNLKSNDMARSDNMHRVRLRASEREREVFKVQLNLPLEVPPTDRG